MFNTLTIEQQLALRFFNLEMTYPKELVVGYVHRALNSPSPDFDDETISVNRNDSSTMLAVQVIQIERFFGKELTLRFLSFNYIKKN